MILKRFVIPSLGGRSCLKNNKKMDHPTPRKNLPKSSPIQFRRRVTLAWPMGFERSPETRALAESLSRDIIRGNPNVKWESIKGLENAKRLLKEAVVMPIKYPSYFNGLLSPWKGILLFGPPGTGKTMLAKAVATECNTTFFNISASSVVSKWRGDSEKLIRVLFDLAKHHAPSTIFLDEIDAIISQRGGEGRSEHEASRRLKTELLIQMDGLQKTNELVFVLAATNLPWELDAAMLRRLEKRILVPLPDPEARRGMFEMLLPSQPGDEPLPHDVLVEKSEGYSGSDIRILCKEAAMQPLRRTLAVLEDTEETVPENELPKVGAILPEDIDRALSNTRPSAHLHAHLYDKFNDDYVCLYIITFALFRLNWGLSLTPSPFLELTTRGVSHSSSSAVPSPLLEAKILAVCFSNILFSASVIVNLFLSESFATSRWKSE
ncbi:hypothetical protein IGI04_010361, partial [Brassica rapa subsp. trilocularis]